jgi:SAM-dependent methyltransferase
MPNMRTFWSAARPENDDASRAPDAVEIEPARALHGFAAGTCPPDSAFDQFLDEPLRSLSAQHWTPLAVAAKAARWLDEYNVRTVLDIGSGAGKFCVAAALASHCHFTGLEHRASLVARARVLARRFGVAARTCFIRGAFGTVPLPRVDAYYLYNPFEECIVEPAQRIDASVVGRERRARDLASLEALLARAPAGTYVLTYGRFGGPLPPSYGRLRIASGFPNELCLWRKTASRVMCRPSGSGLAASPGAAWRRGEPEKTGTLRHPRALRFHSLPIGPPGVAATSLPVCRSTTAIRAP